MLLNRVRSCRRKETRKKVMRLIIALHTGDYLCLHLLSEPEKRNICPVASVETSYEKVILRDQDRMEAKPEMLIHTCAEKVLSGETKNCLRLKQRKVAGRYSSTACRNSFAETDGKLLVGEWKLIYKRKADFIDILVCIFLTGNIRKY